MRRAILIFMDNRNIPQDKLFQAMVEYLETMIALGKLPPGSRIPPLRELAEQFNLSIGTVARGIKFLVDNKLLDTRHGSGTFVRRPAPKNKNSKPEIRIGIFIFNSDENEHYCANALLGVQQEAANHNCRLQTRFRSHEEATPVQLAKAAVENDVILFLGDYDTHITELPQLRPCVGLEMHSSFNGLNSTVTLDPVDAAEMAVKFFRDAGCDKVSVISHKGPVHATRAMHFRESWKPYGRCNIREFHDNALHLYRPLKPALESGIGHLFVSGTTANKAAKEFREATGKLLAAAHPVLSLDGKSRYVRFYEPMNCIGIDWRETGRLAFHECLRRVANPGAAARRIYVHGLFFPYDEK